MRVDINFPFVGHFDAVEGLNSLTNPAQGIIHDASFIGKRFELRR
jgi:hypothetical protein